MKKWFVVGFKYYVQEFGGWGFLFFPILLPLWFICFLLGTIEAWANS